MRATARELWALGLLFGALACAPQRGTIGAVLSQTPDGQLVIHDAPSGLAADRAGLQPGDEILTIDGRDVRALDAKQLRDQLGGDVDSQVKLTVLRGERVLRVTLKRTPSRKHRVAE